MHVAIGTYIIPECILFVMIYFFSTVSEYLLFFNQIYLYNSIVSCDAVNGSYDGIKYYAGYWRIRADLSREYTDL